MTTPILDSPAPPSATPGAILIETPRLILRRWLPSDAQDLHIIANHKEVAANLSHRFPYPYTLEVAQATLQRWDDLAASTSLLYPTSVAVCLKPRQEDEPAELIGSMGLLPGEAIEYRTWTLGYFVTPSAWGKGYATEAVSALVRWSFETWPKLNRIEADFYHWNTASERVLTKSGFVKEGVKRGAIEKWGVISDDVIYGLLRSDLEGKEAI